MQTLILTQLKNYRTLFNKSNQLAIKFQYDLVVQEKLQALHLIKRTCKKGSRLFLALPPAGVLAVVYAHAGHAR